MSGNSGLNNFKDVNTYYTGKFKDVPSSAWYADNVAKVYKLGLMIGKSNSHFDPNGNVTLAEAITIAARIHSIYNTGSENFKKNGTWYKCYVDYAKANDIITQSYSNYNKVATRAEFAYIFSNALPDDALQAVNTIEEGAIPDVYGSVYYKDSVYQLYRAGILRGNNSFGTFSPNSTISRCEAAAIATRMADTSLRVKFTLKASSSSTEEAFAQEVVRLVNIKRANHGLNALTISTKNAQAAKVRAAEIQSKFSHTRPNGTSCFTALAAYGVNYNYAGENIAIGQRTPEQVVQEWMDSSTHRANILKPVYNKIGIGIKKNTSSKYAGYAWVQFFTD